MKWEQIEVELKKKKLVTVMQYQSPISSNSKHHKQENNTQEAHFLSEKTIIELQQNHLWNAR